MILRYLSADDYSTDASWQLAEWCLERGVDEFTIQCLGSSPSVNALTWQPFADLVGLFARPSAMRRRLTAASVAELSRPTELWEFNATTLLALRGVLREGLFDYRTSHDGWFEDPILYRNGELMLGVVTHESSAVLRLSEEEWPLFTAAGFPSHETSEWIGY